MSSSPSDKCTKRLVQEQKMMRQSPPEFIKATPDDSNILVWYYVLDGPKDTPYEGGKYLGKVKFPCDYPFAPPSILMSTPNGRFKTETRLCLSISDFHPKEWNPVWNSSTILTGLLSFMVGSDQTHGSVDTSAAFKRDMAKKSHRFNIQQPFYQKLFPEDYAVSKAIVDEEDRLSGKHSGGSAASRSSAEADSNAASHRVIKSREPWEDTVSKVLQGAMLVCVVGVIAYALWGSGTVM